MKFPNGVGRMAAMGVVAGLGLAGCESDGSVSTAGFSTAIEGLGTFAACKGLTRANDTTCLAAGAAGALVGYGIGKRLQDKRDAEAREAAVQRALAQKSAQPVRWDNSRNKGAKGTVTLTRTYTSASKRQCKSGTESARLPNGKSYNEQITLCYNDKTARYEPV